MRVTQSSILLIVAILGLCCCSPEPPEDEEPPPSEAVQIYKHTPTWCQVNCWSLTLYRSETYIELRAHDRGDDAFLGVATGTLSDTASAELDQLLDPPWDLGEFGGRVSHDAPLIELWLPGLRLVYEQGNPPSGLAELDAFLAKILEDMSQCRATTQITPDHDCEPLLWFPESES